MPTPICQPVASANVLPEGGILFSEYDGSKYADAVTRVWLWSNQMPAAQSILVIPSNDELYLSPNGEKLVWHEYKADHFTIYNLISKKQEDFPWRASWDSIHGWRDDDTVSILVKYEVIFQAGSTVEYVYFDLAARTFSSKGITLDLPGYTEDPTFFPPYNAFAVMDPTASEVFYARSGGKNGALVLVDRNGKGVLWEHQEPYVFYPIPAWASDGSRVVFVLYDKKRPIIYTLTRDGKTSEIIGEGEPPRIIRDIRWSPDNKYIYYAYWNTINEGPAFLIDVATRETTEICTPGYIVLKGSWLPKNHFAYTVREGEQTDADGIAEVRIMNTEDWIFQTVFRTATKVGPTTGFFHSLDILGWTPFSSP